MKATEKFKKPVRSRQASERGTTPCASPSSGSAVTKLAANGDNASSAEASKRAKVTASSPKQKPKKPKAGIAPIKPEFVHFIPTTT